jgi:hypothetical protein
MQIDSHQPFWIYDAAGEVGDCAHWPVRLPAASYDRVKGLFAQTVARFTG